MSYFVHNWTYVSCRLHRMEQYTLATSISYIASQGTTLSGREEACLTAALAKLKASQKAGSVYFFGRISGDEDDYYVAFILQTQPNGEFPKKRFYWTSAASGFVFSDLPSLSPAEASLARKERSGFRGKPAKIVGLSDEEQEALETAEPGDEAGEVKEKILRITELQRLSYVVKSIDFETSAVPQGAFILNDDNALIADSTFKGLGYSDAKNIKHWSHFRKPVDVAKAEALKTPFDSLTEDKPNGCWTIRGDAAANAVVIRSLLWPGYSAFHIPGTALFGGAYLGDGRRNNDLPFLLL